jgi:hypothetical protein
MRPAAFPVVALAALALAGCLGAPAVGTGEGLAVEYQVSNDAATDYEVRLAVTPDPFDGVRVTFENGTGRTYDVGRIDQLPDGALGNATALEPLGEDVQTRTLTVDARTGFGGTFENVTDPSVVLYTVREADGNVAFRGWGGVRCPPADDRLRLELTIHGDDSFDAGVTCVGS